jgi:small subunit ribosomal protein S9
VSTDTTSGERYRATGKRKTSVARVIMTPGTGVVTCNGRPVDEFFGRKVLVTQATRPLAVAGVEGRFDVAATLHGGGVSGQAGALRHGIARALTSIDAELRTDLKSEGFLTRDARIKERKKAGLKGARKRPQFSKR